MSVTRPVYQRFSRLQMDENQAIEFKGKNLVPVGLVKHSLNIQFFDPTLKAHLKLLPSDITKLALIIYIFVKIEKMPG
jgi:hypothetical protein